MDNDLMDDAGTNGASWYRELTGQAGINEGQTVNLLVGDRRIAVAGLTLAQSAELRRRWGAFLVSGDAAPAYTLKLVATEQSGWLPPATPGELYRIEALNDPEQRVIASYNFALARTQTSGLWHGGIYELGGEPIGRILDNMVRFMTALLAVESGGLALHAAGLLHRGQAVVLAGASGSGKTTAVSMARAATSMGDDMAIVVPDGAAWRVPPLPFDNAEQVTELPPLGWHPLAGIWRLIQAPQHKLSQPPLGQAVASLMGCLSFPWVFPELAAALLERCTALVVGGRYAHLEFRKDPGFWELLTG